MIIYQVTVEVDHDEANWIMWMKEKHIPEVMKTGSFSSFKICRIMNEESEKHTYVIQYACKSREALEYYFEHFAPVLQKGYNEYFNGKFTATRSILEVLE